MPSVSIRHTSPLQLHFAVILAITLFSLGQTTPGVAQEAEQKAAPATEPTKPGEPAKEPESEKAKTETKADPQPPAESTQAENASEKKPAEKPAEPESAASKPDDSAAKEDAKSAEKAKAKQDTRVELREAWLGELPWREIGPANMSGRITDLVINDADPSMWSIATASGGMLKTTNHGVTVQHQFDDQTTVSIGAIAAAPSDPDILWVGTGEANPRNSVSYGDGVYKSTDGGKTFTHVGLKESYQIGRILIDPKDPNIVYVGALGRLYGPNRQRGVFKTTDGGENWSQVLYVDDNTGVIDMTMHPEDPNTLIAALWDRQRDGFDSWPGSVKRPEGVDGYDPIRKWGKGAGLYKTTDGGQSWSKLNKGLPPGKFGRVGLDWQTKSPHTIYAIIDCEDIGKGPKPFDTYLGAVGVDRKKHPTITQVMPKSAADKMGLQVDDILIAIGDQPVEKFDDLLDHVRELELGQRLTLTVQRGDQEIETSAKLPPRPGSNREMPTVWLGVRGENTAGGILLKTVSEKSPAGEAGLQPKDIVVAADGEAADDYDALIKRVQAKAAGDALRLKVKRGDETLELTATLANRPTRGGPRRSSAFMGIQGEDAPGGGAKMNVITEDGPSEQAGLKAGDVITKVEGEKLADYEGLVAEIRKRQPEDKMKVSVTRDEKTLTIEVTLGDRNGTGGKRPYTYSYYGQRPNIQDLQGSQGHRYGGVYKSTDAGETWQRVNSLNTRPMYFSVVRVDPSDENRVYVLGVSQFKSTDGGRTFQSGFGRGVHADAHDLWINPEDGRHMIIGGDGGVYVSYDRGENWDHINTAAIGQFYHVAISLKEPYWVVGGLQDNGSWAGPAISRNGGAINEDWIRVGSGDGFVCHVDPDDPDQMYYESQNGNISRRHLGTGERASIRPPRSRDREYRFNWETPFILSSHNPRILYSAGNYVFRSYDRGDDMKIISPEITRTKRGSATALAESPVDPDVLYVGTDDGALWVTTNGGKKWNKIAENLGAPGPRWVTSIEASRFKAGRVYVALDGHRSDDDNPYAFVSEDYGQTFQPLHRDLPRGSTRCLREDVKNENLLYMGTEFAFFISVDRGRTWHQCNQKLPTVAIHDVAIHPTGDEIVLATHGRSLWACDVSILRELDAKSLSEPAAFYEVADVTRWRSAPRRGGTNRRYVADNPSRGATLWYSLGKPAKSAKFQLKNIEGNVIRELKAETKPGLHKATWNLTGRPANNRRARPVRSGAYQVAFMVDDEVVQIRAINILRDPDLPSGAVADEVYEMDLLRDQRAAERKAAAKNAGVDVDQND